MIIVDRIIPMGELKQIASGLYVEMVKAVADVDAGILAIDAELHSDLEYLLIENGSDPNSLWGFNIFPDLFVTEDFIEFDSLINIRPRQNNCSRDVEDASVRQSIRDIVNKHFSE